MNIIYCQENSILFITDVILKAVPRNGPWHYFIFPGELQSEKTSGTGQSEYPGTLERGTSQRARLTGANKRMFNLLRKAKVQLIKIDQQKQLKSSGVRS